MLASRPKRARGVVRDGVGEHRCSGAGVGELVSEEPAPRASQPGACATYRRRRPLLILLCSALSTCASSASSLASARACLASASAAPKMGALAIATSFAKSNKARNVAWRLQNTLESIRILSVCDDIYHDGEKLGGGQFFLSAAVGPYRELNLLEL